jgi:hypothetical protein
MIGEIARVRVTELRVHTLVGELDMPAVRPAPLPQLHAAGGA